MKERKKEGKEENGGARKAPELLLNDPEHRQARLLDLPPMGVRVEAVVTDHDLQPRVDQAWDQMEDTRLVHSALGHRVMEMGVNTGPWKPVSGEGRARRELSVIMVIKIDINVNSTGIYARMAKTILPRR